jgi:dolichyl-diphosphooligosaccharide--protein glycosyltransferase
MAVASSVVSRVTEDRAFIQAGLEGTRMSDASEVARLLADRPDLRPAVEAALVVDERHETWAFGDIDADSGAFGELVSRGVVEKTAGAYRLANPTAVEAALEDAGTVEATPSESTSPSPDGGAIAALRASQERSSLLQLSATGRVALGLVGALAFVVALRLTVWERIFYSDAVVLSANDPYFYRYWVDQVVAAGGTLDFGGLAALPGGVRGGEPLLVATLWFFTSLVGGSQTASGLVLAWYPVVSAVLVGLLTYVFTRELTDDRRIAIAAVAMLAVIPVHVFRSGLGFADHHAFDYIWLTLTAASVVMLARLPATRETFTQPGRPLVLGVGGVTVGVSGQVLAWEAGPLLLLPLLVYLPMVTVLAARDGTSAFWANAPVLLGLALGGTLSGSVHLLFDWHSAVVAFTPLLLFAGGLAVSVAAEAIRRISLPATDLSVLLVVMTAGFIAFMSAVTLVVPAVGETLFARIGVLIDSRPIVEYQPLFSLQANGWLRLLGPVLFFAIAGFVWGSRRAWSGSRRWLAGVAYGWSFLFLASLQQRFAGELAPFVAAFAGLALVYLAWKSEVLSDPVPFTDASDRLTGVGWPSIKQFGVIVFLFLLIGGYGIVQGPSYASKAPITEGEYGAAAFTAEFAEAQDLSYPDNRVLATWWRHRMYNYFVNGEARSYRYAQNEYVPFLSSPSPGFWYEKFEREEFQTRHERYGVLNKPVGFIVLDPNYNTDRDVVLSRLREHYGSHSDTSQGVSHYRLIYEHDSQTGVYQVFQVVPGATITGTLSSNESFVTATDVSAEGVSFSYQRRVVPAENGAFSLTVSYPGTYTFRNRTVTVNETAVTRGETIQLEK